MIRGHPGLHRPDPLFPTATLCRALPPLATPEARSRRQPPPLCLCSYDVLSCAVAASQARVRASGSALRVMSVTTERMSAPAASTPGARSTVRPPMATSGIAPTRRFHSFTFSRPCGSHFIFFRMKSEEHTSELQSLMRISYAVFCLKQKTTQQHNLQYASPLH